jgi:hypothetical protein
MHLREYYMIELLYNTNIFLIVNYSVKMSYPYEIKQLNEEDDKKLQKDFLCDPNCYWQVRKKITSFNKISGGELYVLARHHKMCKLAHWSRNPKNWAREQYYILLTRPWSCYRRVSQTTEHKHAGRVNHLITL